MRRRDVLGAALAATLASAAAQSRARVPAGSDLIGVPGHVIATAETTLADLALLHDLGFVELAIANPGVDPWLPPAGAGIVLPSAHLLPDAARQGIVVNYADQRLYHFRNGMIAATHPIGIAAEDVPTRLGLTSVVGKRRDPSWSPTPSMRATMPDLPAFIPPGPENPLGSRALDLGWPGYVIHGTNRPYGIGRRVSQGCVRLYEADIVPLFEAVATGTPVRFVDQPVKLGWADRRLLLEIHPDVDQVPALQESRPPMHAPRVELPLRVVIAAGARSDAIDWDRVDAIAARRDGMPAAILIAGPDD
jgi:L,D-transpeptidase ErfK/SrfK